MIERHLCSVRQRQLLRNTLDSCWRLVRHVLVARQEAVELLHCRLRTRWHPGAGCRLHWDAGAGKLGGLSKLTWADADAAIVSVGGGSPKTGVLDDAGVLARLDGAGHELDSL